MEEAIYIITHILMAGCCIMIVVVGMNVKEENCLIIDEQNEYQLSKTDTLPVAAPARQELQLTSN
jgi:hypothetical protein